MKKISKPGDYQGYTEAVYDGWKRFSEYVSMRDGVKIAIDYYRPTKNGVIEEQPLPVVWIFTPYDYRTIFATGKFADGTVYTPDIEEDTLGHAKLLVSHGYIFALAEVRGTGASFGFRQSVNSDLEAWDGYELCQWLSRQKWSNGNIGTFGYSYYGSTQLEMLRKNPPALKASFIGMTDLDKYDGWVRGGSLRAFGTQPDMAYLEDLKNIPVGICNTENEQKTLRSAVMQHRFSTKQSDNMKSCPYRDSWCEDTDTDLWLDISHSTYLDQINKSNAAVYLYGGWRDVFRRDTVMMFRNLTLKKKMLFGPWWHLDNRPGFNIGVEKLRFFDHYLKGINNGIMNEPAIYYSTGNAREGNEWAFSDHWPLPEVTNMSLFLNGKISGETLTGYLTPTAPEEEDCRDVYRVVYNINENIDDHTQTIDRDTKGITYTSIPLEEDLLVTGHPIMELWISSTSDDGDFFVHLVDVNENDEGTYVSDGKLRASLRKVSNPPYDFANLPWHRCNQADEHKLVPGRPYRLQIDLMPMSHLFRKGHKIRVTITCACQKIYFLQDDISPIVSIYRDTIHTSYIKLPIVNKSCKA